MVEYKIFFKKSVYKELSAIPRTDLQRILKKIDSLRSNPRPQGCEKLSHEERYRLRQGNYRIVYSIQNDVLTVWIIKVAHRKEVYRH